MNASSSLPSTSSRSLPVLTSASLPPVASNARSFYERPGDPPGFSRRPGSKSNSASGSNSSSTPLKLATPPSLPSLPLLDPNPKVSNVSAPTRSSSSTVANSGPSSRRRTSSTAASTLPPAPNPAPAPAAPPVRNFWARPGDPPGFVRRPGSTSRSNGTTLSTSASNDYSRFKLPTLPPRPGASIAQSLPATASSTSNATPPTSNKRTFGDLDGKYNLSSKLARLEEDVEEDVAIVAPENRATPLTNPRELLVFLVAATSTYLFLASLPQSLGSLLREWRQLPMKSLGNRVLDN